MFELSLLCPLAGNDNVPFTKQHFDELEARVVALSGGFTKRGPVHGGWRGPRGVVLELSWEYTILVESVSRWPRVLDLIAFCLVRFHQDAIYIRRLGLAEALTMRDIAEALSPLAHIESMPAASLVRVEDLNYHKGSTS